MPVNYNSDVLGPTTDLIPQYNQYHTWSTPGNWQKGTCTYLGSLKLQGDPSKIRDETARKASRFTLAMRLTNGTDNVPHNISDVFVSAYEKSADELEVTLDTHSLTSFEDTSEFFKFYVFWYKTSLTDTAEFEVELWLESRDGINTIDIQPTFFKTYLDDELAIYDKVANVHYSEYSRINSLFYGMSAIKISHEEMMAKHPSPNWSFVQSYSSYPADVSTNDTVTLDKYQEYVTLGTNGKNRTISAIVPQDQNEYQNGRRIACVCWNAITFAHAGNIADASANHLVMRGNQNYTCGLNEIVEFLRVGQIWVQI